MKKLLSVALLFIPFHVAFSQTTKFIDEVNSGKGDDIIISYKKYELANGLTVILHEDHSDPVVHVEVMYHVGSARELVGRSGFAHFFEHMMFQGSEHVRDEEHFKIVTESGGRLNGTTNLDRTNYYETLPSNQLETALWLEADRMGWFLDSVTQSKFEIQRATVKNERGQNYDNRPYGLAREKTAEALYPFGHPYSWLTIGYIEDLNAATLDDLKRFFLRWYGPNNATLVVAGDIESDKTLQLIEKYFGAIPRGPEVKNMEKNVPVLNENRFISYEDNVRNPMLMISIPSVPARHPDEAPLDVLADILGGGKNSIFYQNMVKTQKALRSNVYNGCNELSGEFTMMLIPYPGVSLNDLNVLVQQSLNDFETRGVKDDDINKFVASYISGEINSLQSVSGKASKLANYQTFTGSPNYIKKDLERYENVKKEDVLRVYNTYIKNKFGVYLSVVPKGKTDMVLTADNFERPKVPVGFVNDLSEYADLTYNRGTYPFEKDYRPAAGPNPVVSVPDYWTSDMDNGLKIIGTKYTELPVVSLTFSIGGGHLLDPNGKSGLAYLTAQMMNEGTLQLTPEELSQKLELLGSSIQVYATDENMVVSLFTLKEKLDESIALLKDVMFTPRFEQADFDRLKTQLLESIENRKDNARTIADIVTAKLQFGNTNLGTPSSGLKETVERITLDDVKKFYEDNFAPEVTNLVVVGNVSKGEISKKLDFLKAWKQKKVNLPKYQKSSSPNKTTIYLVDKPGAAQSEIRVAGPGLEYDVTGQYYRAGIMNYALGGAFNCRLNLNLREQKGYTYGVRAGFNGSLYQGTYEVRGGFLAHATDSVVMEIMRELTEYKLNGITEPEVLFTKSSIGQRDALAYETVGQKASFMSRILRYNLNKDFVKQQINILNGLTAFDINQLAKTLLTPDKMYVVIVGDKAKIYNNLKKLGYDIVELDMNGDEIEVEKSMDAPRRISPDEKR